MSERNTAEKVAPKSKDEERELSLEELDEVNGGTGTQVINATAANTASGSDKAKHPV